MLEPRTPTIRAWLRAPAIGALVLLAVVLMGGAATEEGLVRQLKIDVFDQNWEAVLAGCEQLLERFPAGASAPRASFYRARALAHIPGREADGLEAFRRFVQTYPGETVLVEQAWSDIFSLACGDGEEGDGGCVATLSRALDSPSSYVSTLAAITAADVQDTALRRKALQVLKSSYAAQTDPDVRNEILIAILKIDPAEIPPPEPGRKEVTPAKPGAKGQPRLIRLTVFNKEEGTFDLKVNLPVAFARMLIDALGEPQKRELRRGAREQGVDIDDIFDAIQRSGAGRLLEVDTEDSRIEIWIE